MFTCRDSGCKAMASYSSNMMRCALAIFLAILVLQVRSRKPNIVLMIADDLGYGDVGCFGNSTLRTPHIDSLAADGAKLTQHLTASSLCSPSRAAMLTGRYPVRSGKWHLGWSKDRLSDFAHHPMKHGFDYFYGLPLTNIKDFGSEGERLMKSVDPYIYYRILSIFLVMFITASCLYKSNNIGILFFLLILFTITAVFGLLYFVTDNFKLLNSQIYREYDNVEQPIDLETLMRKLVIEGQEFLEERSKDDAPFLLVMSWTHVHTYLHPAKRFGGKSRHGTYGDSVEELDWAVGEILKSLEQLGFKDNTMVYFTSDNGGHLEERNKHGEPHGGYNGILRGGKAHGTVDGGIRVPTVMRWPGHITPGTVVDEPTSLMDVLPTVAKAMGASVPDDRQLDGYDLLPLLQKQTLVSSHEFMFHYCGTEVHAVRYRPREGKSVWKLALKEPPYLPGQDVCMFICHCANSITLDPPYLYDMTSDPGERRPMNATDLPEIYHKMQEALKDHQQGLIPVETQYSLAKLFWRPWLQPCCNSNYPTCSCTDPKFNNKKYKFD
ncbi:steryl-sulfatase-like [Gigantopelta aegis]|uniref:steryl-sulfatase-like n=1 Tax=Gigantopelta aegis TaxID=1735272 RepID=UPI001B88BB46|nr:steryl-sulfatase-like [Gigantopelta aegis]